MNLKIGSREILINNCVRMRDIQRGAYLAITIPRDSIGYDDLEALLRNNENPIIVTDDEGGETCYIGFRELYAVTIRDSLYNVEQLCTSETAFQLSLAQNKITEQQDSIAELTTLNADILYDVCLLQLGGNN